MRRNSFLAVATITLAALALQAQDVTGDWQGVLKATDTDLHLVLHVSQGSDGVLRAKLDSLDQGALGLEAASVALWESKLSFTLPSAHGMYQGAVSPAADTIDGTWLQGKPLPLVFHRAAPEVKVPPSDIDGAWSGTLDAPQGEIRIVFRIVNRASGLTATVESPDKGTGAAPVSTVTREGPSLKLDMKQLGAAFAGKVSTDFSAIDGEWTQGQGHLPLMLKRQANRD